MRVLHLGEARPVKKRNSHG